MKYTTLLIDVDNTILDFDANEASSFRSMLKELGEEFSDELYQTYHWTNIGIWRQIERGEISADEGVNSRFAILMRQYGREVDGRKWENVYRSYLNRGLQEIPHVHEVLSRLQKDFRLYVITNGLEDAQMYRMGASGVSKYFLDCFISEQIGANKPSKAYFDYVKKHIPNFMSEETLVIGDSLTSDIKGGHDAGLDTCWFIRDKGAQPENIIPTYTIHDLRELFPILYT